MQIKREKYLQELINACGNCMIKVITGMRRCGKSYVFGDGNPGKLSEKLYNKLRGIQYGTEPDEFGWITIVEGI